MSAALVLRGLAPEPQEEWQQMLRFVSWSESDRVAASRSVEVLSRHAAELVVGTYEYLSRVPETAAILGWERGLDQSHLEERRRFFTIWLARTLGLDCSDEFAYYLFRAGKFHAGQGPRQIHTPPRYVTGSVGLILASFSGYMAGAALPADVIAGAMGAWSKYLAVQLNQMLFGYQVARSLETGPLTVRCTLYGRLRPLLGTNEIRVHAEVGATAGDVLRKVFNAYPQARAEAFERVWDSEEKSDALWVEVVRDYVPHRGWRTLLNGRDLAYAGGFDVPVRDGDEIALFPPGR